MSFAGRSAAALVALAAATLGRPDPASACSCAEREPALIIDTSEAIFRGKVIGYERKVARFFFGGDQVGPEIVFLVRLAVEKTWKGAETEEVSVMIIAQGDACGTDSVEIGEPWLVFAWAHAGGLMTNKCASWGMEPHDLTELLGEGEAPSEPGRGPEPQLDVPARSAPPYVRPKRGCACETALGGASSKSSAPSGWGLLAAGLVAIGARRLARGGSRVQSHFQPDR